MNKTVYSFSVLAAAQLAILAALLTGQQFTPATAPIVSGPRPVAMAADILEGRYAKPVTYEDPVWEWHGDVVSESWMNVRNGSLIPRTRQFPMPPPETAPGGSAAQSGVNAVLDSYFRRNSDGPRFRTVSSRFGTHIVPDETTATDGSRVQVKPLLDESVTIPADARRLMDHLQAITDELSKVSGVEVRANTPILGFGLERLFQGSNAVLLTWGSSGVSARDALIDLLEHSATTLSWRLLCQPGTSARDRFCVLSITPIRLTITSRDGSLEDRSLEFDRCGKCPPLAPKAPIQ
jgi:hypothetical protein